MPLTVRSEPRDWAYLPDGLVRRGKRSVQVLRANACMHAVRPDAVRHARI